MQNVKQLKVFGFRNVTAIKIQCRFARRSALIAAATILAAIQEGLDCAPNLFGLLFVCFHRQILAQATTKTQNYKRFEGFAKDANLPTNLSSKFQKLWLKAAKKKFKPGSDELDKLLKYTNKRTNRTRWFAGETPKKRR